MCKQTGFIHQELRDFDFDSSIESLTVTDDPDSSLESLTVTRFESFCKKNGTRADSSHHFSHRHSTRVRVTINRDASRLESLTRVTLSLVQCRKCRLISCIYVLTNIECICGEKCFNLGYLFCLLKDHVFPNCTELDLWLSFSLWNRQGTIYPHLVVV